MERKQREWDISYLNYNHICYLTKANMSCKKSSNIFTAILNNWFNASYFLTTVIFEMWQRVTAEDTLAKFCRHFYKVTLNFCESINRFDPNPIVAFF